MNVFRRSCLRKRGPCARNDISASRSHRRTGVAPDIVRRRLVALERHGESILHRDVIALATSLCHRARLGFTLSISQAAKYLVAHGRGSDPRHTGWLERVSNASGITSAGAYRTEGVTWAPMPLDPAARIARQQQ